MNRTEPFEVYKIYLALKQHFCNPNYDIVKYNGKVKASNKSFEARRDKTFFYKLAKKYNSTEVFDFFIANFVSGDEYGGIFNEQAEPIYLKWKKKIQSMGYVFSQEIDSLLQEGDINKIINMEGGSSLLLNKLYKEKISLETFIILDKIFSLLHFYSKVNNILWEEYRKRIAKYSLVFKTFDRNKYIKILKTKLLNS